jgi:hypothetical protein
MHSDDRTNKADEAEIKPIVSALVNRLDESVQQIPISTREALAEARAKALGRNKHQWRWALAASVLVIFGFMAWNLQPQESDAMAFELMQTDDQLLNELEFLESLAEVDET